MVCCTTLWWDGAGKGRGWKTAAIIYIDSRALALTKEASGNSRGVSLYQWCWWFSRQSAMVSNSCFLLSSIWGPLRHSDSLWILQCVSSQGTDWIAYIMLMLVDADAGPCTGWGWGCSHAHGIFSDHWSARTSQLAPHRLQQRHPRFCRGTANACVQPWHLLHHEHRVSMWLQRGELWSRAVLFYMFCLGWVVFLWLFWAMLSFGMCLFCWTWTCHQLTFVSWLLDTEPVTRVSPSPCLAAASNWTNPPSLLCGCCVKGNKV